MPGSISDSYEGPADPCPVCRGVVFAPFAPLPPCTFCGGTGVWPDGKSCPDGTHKWTGQQMGGSPDTAEAAEWVGYCDVCGVEKTDDN